jgi:hypothetical protein
MTPYEFHSALANSCQFCKTEKMTFTYYRNVTHTQTEAVERQAEGFICSLKKKPDPRDLPMFNTRCSEFQESICPIAQAELVCPRKKKEVK